MKQQTAIVFTDGMLDTAYAKTCHGLLRGSERFKIVGVIDAKFAGRDAGEVMDGQVLGVPVYDCVTSFMESGAA